MSKLFLCPDCGKLLSPRFPIHTCRRKPTAKGHGPSARKLAKVLEDLLAPTYPGISIQPEDFWFQKGDYVKATWDLARWGADVKYERGKTVSVYSWDTMRSCAKGCTMFTPKGALPNEWEIVAK